MSKDKQTSFGKFTVSDQTEQLRKELLERILKLYGYSSDLNIKTTPEFRKAKKEVEAELRKATLKCLNEEFLKEESKKLLADYYTKVVDKLDRLIKQDREELIMNTSTRAVIQRLLKKLDVLADNPPTDENVAETKNLLQGLYCIIETLLSMKRKDRIAL